MGQPELSQDPRFSTFWARFQNVDELDAVIGEWAAQHDAGEIDALLNQAGVVCGPINSVAGLFEDPQIRSRDMLVPVEDEELGQLILPGVVPKLTRTPGEVRWPGRWQVGHDNRAVFGALLGMGEDEVRRLEEEGVA
jgi:formyl-CoA transferase